MNTRQEDILLLGEKHGEITIKDLSRKFGVSDMTIHRDLDFLEKEKYLYKKRGAAVFVETQNYNKTQFYAEEKRDIGKTAASQSQHRIYPPG